MERDVILNEYLTEIYILDEFDLSQIKSKVKDLVDSAKSGNILKANKEFSKLKKISLDDLAVFARKKMPAEYKSAKTYVNQKVKKDNKFKEPLVLTRTCLKTLEKETDDPDVKNKIQENLKKLDDILKNMEDKGMVETGVTMLFLALLTSFFLGSVLPTMVTLLTYTGVAFIAVAILVYITRAILDLFIESKKQGKKVVS
jgi:ribosomal protein S20